MVFYYTRFYHLVGSRQDFNHQLLGDFLAPTRNLTWGGGVSVPSVARVYPQHHSPKKNRVARPSTAHSREAAAPPLPSAQPLCPAPALRTWLAAPGRPRRLAPALCALRVPAGRAEPGHARAPCLRAADSTASVLGHLTAAVAHAPKTFSSSSEPWPPRLSAPPHPRPSRCSDLAPAATVGCCPGGRPGCCGLGGC